MHPDAIPTTVSREPTLVELLHSMRDLAVESPMVCLPAPAIQHLTTVPRPGGSLPAWRERQIKQLMRAELEQPLPLQRLARECGLSVRHFTRAFRLTTGLSPHRYLLQLRLHKARQLLLDPELRLDDIAVACGFADQSHFTRAFNGVERMTPGTWRRLNLR